jgi:enamine deaminase RidA (YjgF/YER057c/UK114 family)
MKSSPIFSRVARVSSPTTIYVSNLYAPSSDPAEQVREVFGELKRILEPLDSDLRHLVKATYYITDDETSKALGSIRPEYYDPQRPPAASKALVRGTGRPGKSLTLDMLAVPAK